MLNRGKLAVLAMFAVALAAAMFAWWWNYSRRQQCLAFYGPQAALLIRTAEDVELIELAPDSDQSAVGSVDRLTVGDRAYLIKRITTIGQAKGLIHARTSILDDASFIWDAAPDDCAGQVPYAIRFTDYATDARATVAFDFGCQRLWYVDQQKSARLIPKVAQGWESFLKRQAAAAEKDTKSNRSPSIPSPNQRAIE
jgi:hypothetical protein